MMGMAGPLTVFTLVFILVAFALGQISAFDSGCELVKKVDTSNFICRNITQFPKDIDGKANALLIQHSVLKFSELENIVVPENVTKIEIFNSALKGLAFEKMVLPASITELIISNSKIRNIRKFKPNRNLQLLDIQLNKPVKLNIEPGAFDNLYGLISLVLTDSEIDSFPVFNREHKKLGKLSFSGNNIEEFKAEQLKNLPSLTELFLMQNKFTSLRNGMFKFGNNIEEMYLTNNPIKNIESDAFEGLGSLRTLILDGIDIENLPTNGLGDLTTLSLKRVHRLRTIPEGLNSIKVVHLADEKSHLCCKLKFDKTKMGELGPRTFAPEYTTMVMTPTSQVSTPGTTPRNRSTRSHNTVPSGFVRRKRRVIHTLPPSATPNTSEPFIPTVIPTSLECTPGPTAFQPCEDIMGADWLTAVSFIIAPFALCGNFVVLVVFLCLARNYNVSRFLVTNLALADMSMGIYLLSLVIESVITRGEYYLHVDRFQFGLSCKVLGFLAMFSSELSVFSLTLITVERYLTIVYAMYPRYRLTMRTAIICMAVGWAVALTVAILPIFGVGSYGKVAICLPFDTDNGGDMYLFVVFGINGVGFLFICALYAQIYRSVFRTKNSTPTRNHDSRVARRMALLVFTDFACFAPIAITGLSALSGNALIDVKQSKYLLVFFFPLNGLLNPFLYAIITKTFRRDLAVLLKNCFVCGGNLTNYISSFPARSVQSTNDVLSLSARPSLDFNAMGGFHSLGNIRGSRENPVSASFSKSEPNLVKFNQEALNS